MDLWRTRVSQLSTKILNVNSVVIWQLLVFYVSNVPPIWHLIIVTKRQFQLYVHEKKHFRKMCNYITAENGGVFFVLFAYFFPFSRLTPYVKLVMNVLTQYFIFEKCFFSSVGGWEWPNVHLPMFHDFVNSFYFLLAHFSSISPNFKSLGNNSSVKQTY